MSFDKLPDDVSFGPLPYAPCKLAGQFDPVDFLTKQVDKLTVQLQAEQNHGKRLTTAVAHLKEAVGIARGGIMGIKDAAENESYLEVSILSFMMTCIVSEVENADELIQPVAKEISNG